MDAVKRAGLDRLVGVETAYCLTHLIEIANGS
jgi:hypothetical protein